MLRVALYLRERAGVKCGERVGVVGPVGPEALVFEWAALLSGFAVGAIDAVGDEEAIRDAIKSLGARVVLACDERARAPRAKRARRTCVAAAR